MILTPREQALLDLIRASPLASPEELAGRLGTSRAAVNVHVGHLIRKGALLGRGYLLPPERAGVVVVGGTNLDIKARLTGPLTPGTSNPGTATHTAGGVARNVAETLARLGVPTRLLSAVGQDAAGEALLGATAAAGVDVAAVRRSARHATGTYTAVLDQQGELLMAVAAMDVTDELTPQVLQERRGLLAGADWIVADGNLTPDTLAHLLGMAAGSGAKVLLEPVSVPKAARLRPVLTQAGPHAPYAVTPNLAELSALVGREVGPDVADLQGAANDLHALGVALVWVRLGERGSLLSEAAKTGPPQVSAFAALPAQVVDVTGAGDAMLAAFLAALVAGLPPTKAARHGHAAAALTIESPHTTRPDLTPAALLARLGHADQNATSQNAPELPQGDTP